MNTPTTIPANWQQWLQENLARKVPDERLIEVMVKNQFNRVLVLRCIAALRNRPARFETDGLPMPTSLNGDWQRWLSDNIEKGVIEQSLIDATTREIRMAWGKRLAALRAESEAQGYTYENDGAAGVAFGATVETSDRSIPVLMAMDKPRIALLGNVLSKEECEEMIALAEPRMRPSITFDNATARPVVTKQRSSDGTFFKLGETPLVQKLEQRIAEITRWPIAKGEGLQVLNYRDGGEYVPHFDFFPPEQPGSISMLQRGGQRVATLILYLNTVEEGGETYFPKLNLKIKAVQGNALYFHYTNSKAELDRMTLHGGNPVTKGGKWIVTKWMRQEAVETMEGSI